MIYGVDIAGSYQAGIDIQRLAAEGNRFVACKATEGTTYQAPLFDQWISRIRAAGMIAGAYHFIRQGNGADQARFFYDRVKGVGGPQSMIIQLDCESDATYQDIVDWVNEWNALTDHYPFAFYTGHWWLAGKGWNIAALTPYLWAAPNRGYTGSYTGDTSPDWNAGYGGFVKLTIDQYTSNATAGGISGVDADVIRDPSALKALLREDDMLKDELISITTPDGKGVETHDAATWVVWTNRSAWLAWQQGAANAADIAAVKADVAEVKATVTAPVPVNVDAAALKAALLDPEFLAAIAKAVATEEAARLAKPAA